MDMQSVGRLYNNFYDMTIGTVDCEVEKGVGLEIQELSCYPWVFDVGSSSNSPTPSPTQISLKFEGVENAYSIARGEISIFWDLKIVAMAKLWIYRVFSTTSLLRLETMITNLLLLT